MESNSAPKVDGFMPTNPTPREQQVLALRDYGLTRPQIAAQLGIKTGTVAVHLRHLFGRGLAFPRKFEGTKKERIDIALQTAENALEGVQMGDLTRVARALEAIRSV